MKKLLKHFAIIAAFAMLAIPAWADNTAEETLNLFFSSLNDGNYIQTWDQITNTSKNHIAKTVFKEINSLSALSDKAKNDLSPEKIRYWFSIGGAEDTTMVQNYWQSFGEGYAARADIPIKDLINQKWLHIADASDGNSCVLVTDKNTNIKIHMFKVRGQWKVGLYESGAFDSQN